MVNNICIIVYSEALTILTVTGVVMGLFQISTQLYKHKTVMYNLFKMLADH